jgi:hypothetical protein
MDVIEIDEIDDAGEAHRIDEHETLHEGEPSESGGGLGAFVSEHPLATLGGALAAGYILGGGLLTPLTRRLLRTGVRLGFQLALLPQLEKDVAGLAVTLGETLRAASDVPRAAANSPKESQ